ncbi:mechanosensitive ion channel family protein [Thermodesulfobacteriota bacterium]
MEIYGITFNLNTATGAIFLAIIFFVGTAVISKILTIIMTRPEWNVGKLGRKIDKTVIRYIVRIKTIVLFIVMGLFYASLVPGLRALVGTLMAGAGITALVIGFAAKSTLANLVSGLSLAIYRPFRIGDQVTIEQEYGTVEDITLRHTIIRTWENKMLIIPNEKMDNMPVINYSILDPRILCRIEMGVSYDTDIDLASCLILEEANRCPHRLKEAEEPRTRVISHGDFSIGLRLYVWAPDQDSAWQIRFWVLENVKKRFDKEGVEIPFPYRTLVYKKDLSPPRRENPHNEDGNGSGE